MITSSKTAKSKRKRKQKIYSKRLTTITMVFFCAFVTACFVAWLMLREVPDGLVMAVSAACGATAVTYLGKSGYENAKRFENSDYEENEE